MLEFDESKARCQLHQQWIFMNTIHSEVYIYNKEFYYFNTQNTKYKISKKIFLESQLQVFTSASRIFSAIFLSKSHYLWSPCIFRLDCFSDVFDFALCTGNNWNNFTVILELNIGIVYYTVSNSQQQSSVYVFEFKWRRIIIESKTRSH